MMSDARASEHTSAAASSAPLSISSTNVLPFLDISPDALVIVNPAGTIVMVNRQTEAVFGYARTELLGQQLELLLPQRLRAVHIDHREQYFSSPHTRPMGIGLKLVGRRKDGTEFPVEISLNPLLLDDVLHVIGAVRDMTAQRVAEHEHGVGVHREQVAAADEGDPLAVGAERHVLLEPVALGQPHVEEALLSMPNVVLTPHLGSAVTEVREALANVVVDNIAAVVAGQRPPNCWNPEIYAVADERK